MGEVPPFFPNLGVINGGPLWGRGDFPERHFFPQKRAGPKEEGGETPGEEAISTGGGDKSGGGKRPNRENPPF